MTVRAPEFPADATWLNTRHPLRFSSELKGRLVLLDFWTYCCINCMHVLPDLEYLERKYAGEPLVVVGVHSNKFENEGGVTAVRAAVERYWVKHPVVLDPEHKIWDSFAINSWPTLVLVGPDGRLIGQVSGEGHRELLDKVIERSLAEGRAKGILAEGPLELGAEEGHRSTSGLSFPAKVLVDGVNKRLFIVDSNRNRIVVTTWPTEGDEVTVTHVIGAEAAGAADGDFGAATFRRPQGAVLGGADNNILYVADTENHLIRRVDLQKQSVLTILGTGEQEFDPEAGKSGREQALNSPWDVAVLGNRLYISNAGNHQVFAMNLMTGMTEAAAGTGRENILDNEAVNSYLAQPSGLALGAANQVLYFADSETSAIRALDLRKKEVRTLFGRGLFVYGDVDGDSETARLQHPLGVAMGAPGELFVADTYNHKIKRVDLAKNEIATLAGGAGEFFEPANLVAMGNDLLIADTNHHRIVRVNLATRQISELRISGL